MNHDAVYALYSNALYISEDKVFDKDHNIIEIDINAVNAWVDPNGHKYPRAREYPSVTDQLDMLWHAIDSGTLDKTSDFYTKLKAVKTKYPKS